MESLARLPAIRRVPDENLSAHFASRAITHVDRRDIVDASDRDAFLVRDRNVIEADLLAVIIDDVHLPCLLF